MLLMSPLTADAWHSTLSQTDGRDKVLRLMQYVCKLLRALDSGRGSPKAGTMAATAAMVETAVSASRQISRLFKWTSVYANGKSRLFALSLSSTSILDLLSLFADASLFSYYALDNAAFAAKMGLLQQPRASTFARRGARFWLAAILCGALANLLRVHAAHARAVKLLEDAGSASDDGKPAAANDEVMPYSSGASQDAAQAECRDLAHTQSKALLTLGRQLSDGVVAGSAGWDFGTHPGVVGACGSISSAIGLLQLWPRH